VNVKVKLSHRLIIRTVGREGMWKSKRIHTLDNKDVSPLQTFAAVQSKESCPQSLFVGLSGSQNGLETVVKMGRT
jgi:hypothetical protein